MIRLRTVGSCALALLACTLWLRGAAEAPHAPLRAPVLYTATSHYEALAWLRGADRFAQDSSLMVFDGSGSRPLVPQLAASADPAGSFDGTRVLFAGKRSRKDKWQVWELTLSDGHLRRVTSCADDCVRPLYLPDDRLVYAHKLRGRYLLEAAGLDATAPLELTYAPGNALPTDVLRDGRILFEAEYPLGTGSTPELYTVYSDGSGVESYRCDHGAARHSGSQLASGDIVFIRNNAAARFTSPLAHDVPIRLPAGEFAGGFVEAAPAQWIAAWRSPANFKYSLQQVDLGAETLAPLVADSARDLVQPALLAPRTVPNRHPSGLHDWPNANLLCLNAYTSQLHFAPDSIAAVRLYTRTVNGEAVVLGSSPVERDGSFFVQVPADQPLRLELLDAAGKTIKREQGWFWMRRGEQRICVGCHTGPERAPDNVVPAVLLKSTEAVALLPKPTGTHEGGH